MTGEKMCGKRVQSNIGRHATRVHGNTYENCPGLLGTECILDT